MRGMALCCAIAAGRNHGHGWEDGVKLIIQITKGVLRDQTMRRNTMFCVVLAAVLMLFGGSTFLSEFLISRPMYFIFYWAICAWLTVLSLLLALYDLLVVRAQARSMKKRLHTELLGSEDDFS
jgi:hypothetical protein